MAEVLQLEPELELELEDRRQALNVRLVNLMEPRKCLSSTKPLWAKSTHMSTLKK